MSLQVESKGQIFYAYTEAPEDRTRLLQKIDAARRVKITGDDGTALVRADAAKIAVSGGGRKVFSWGVGSMLGNNNQLAQAWALPQVIASLEAPHAAGELCAGPEHAACVSAEGGAQLWGSNEFQQVGVAGPAAIFRPIPLESLGSRKVLSIACGGSHTLAVVADSLDADGGAVVGWGTGTVGQLGLGQTQLLSAEPLVIPLPEIYGNPVPVRKVAAGLVTSAAVLVTGECFVWGDSSLGRLGLPDVPDTLTPAGAPVLVNGKVTWTPRQVDFSACDLGELSGRKVSVAGLGMGGAFTLFLVAAGDGSAVGGGGGAGGVLLVSGALGVDITKDRYGYPEDVLGPASALDALLESEVKGVARALTPRPVAPFGSKAVVLSVSAGARHAGAVALDTAKGDGPRAYSAGKGWLGHGSDAPSLLLPRPTVSQTFAAVGGALASEDGAFYMRLHWLLRCSLTVFVFPAPCLPLMSLCCNRPSSPSIIKNRPLPSTAAVEIACGHSHTVVRTSDGKLYAWGRGDSGELGLGNLTDRSMPSPAKAADGYRWTSVVAGSYYSGALAEAGSAGKTPAGEVVAAVAKRNAAVVAKEAAAVAKYTYSAGSASSGVAADASGGAGEAAADPNALPTGWDYEYDGDGNIYFIGPDGESHSWSHESRA